MSSTNNCRDYSHEQQSNNICVICRDPLLSANCQDHEEEYEEESSSNNNNHDSLCDLGVAIPCGHPVHQSCFEQYSVFQKGKITKTTTTESASSTLAAAAIPCPTCQQMATSFVKVYLRVEPNNKHKLETDHNTASSSSSSNGSGSEEENDSDDSDHDEEDSVVSDSVGANTTLCAPSTATTTNNNNKRKRSLPLSLPSRRSSSQRQPAFSNNKPQPQNDSTKSSGHKRHHKKQKKRATAAPKRKAQWYKQRWMGACDKIKTLCIEAKHRQKCHLEDQFQLERSQNLCMRLCHDLDHTVKMARIGRNCVGMLCFGIGWLVSQKYQHYSILAAAHTTMSNSMST